MGDDAQTYVVSGADKRALRNVTRVCGYEQWCVQVGLGRVKWVAPTGLVGVGPLTAVGPVQLGPSSAEGSSLEVPEVVVHVDPLQSLLQRKIVLQLHAHCAQVMPCSELAYWRCSLCQH
jgi:hypothetical protein